MKASRIYRIYLILFFLIIWISPSVSQVEFSAGADLLSRYIWRGMNLGGNGPSIQPSFDINYTSKNKLHNIGASAWGAYTFSNTASDEIDISIGYTFKEMISLKINDYFFPGLYTGSKDNYFVYNPDSTGHVFEATIGFEGTEKIPVTFLFGMNFYGDDARKMKNDSTIGSIVMSKYIEIGAKFTFKGFDCNAFIGAAFTKPDIGYDNVGYYENTRAGIINVGFKVVKELKLSDLFTLPVQCALITNPMQQNVYIVFGIGLYARSADQ